MLSLLALLAVGCQGPSKANIALRKELQDKNDRIADLQRQHQADLATLKAMENRDNTVPTLPADRLDQMFTVHGITLGRLTGGADFDGKPGDDGLKVYLTPTDDAGDDLKAVGSVVVEAFDLQAKDTHAGRWAFSDAQAKQAWSSVGLLYGFVLKCPFEQPPAHDQLTVRVSFTDGLTGRVFTAQKAVTIQRPAGDKSSQ